MSTVDNIWLSGSLLDHIHVRIGDTTTREMRVHHHSVYYSDHDALCLELVEHTPGK